MKVADIMTREVVTVAPDADITQVAEILFSRRFHGVPVMNNNRIAGIITETDFFTKDTSNIFLPSYISFLRESELADDLPKDKKQAVTKLINVKAKDIMSPKCITVTGGMELAELIEMFKKTKLTTLPVVDDFGNLIGIVTLMDIIGLVKPQEV